MVALDPVKVGDMWRLCYGGTEVPAKVREDRFVDQFETILDLDDAAKGLRNWALLHQSSALPPGFLNRGQAVRCAEMVNTAGVKILPLEEEAEE
jgi:hypothetical protein